MTYILLTKAKEIGILLIIGNEYYTGNTSEENQKTQPGFKPGFSSVWWVGFLFLNNQ